MNRGKLKIEQPLGSLGVRVHIELNEEGQVWLTIPEIAENFDCFLSAVYSNVRTLFKSEELYKEDVCREITYQDGKGDVCISTLYNLDMVLALAFRIKSYRAREFRKWVRKTVITPIYKREVFVIDTHRLETELQS